MALSKGANTYNRVNWEDAEFPILCQVCLGNNPYLRMMKDKFGGECKICFRPFTSFRWCPGRGMRYKKTEICQTCSKLKNVCQTCLLDLEYGLPVQVRDSALQLKDEIPKSGANKDYYLQNIDKQIAEGDKAESMPAYVANELLSKLSRNSPYYRRNLPHICSFWVKGECKRGEECPYRHEKPTDPDDPLADQNLKDRYYGINDPVADKIMGRVKDIPGVSPPEDKSITTVYIGGLGEDGEITEFDLQNYFYQFGEIRSVSVVPSRGCAFVTYTARDAAERAVQRCLSRAAVKGKKLTVRWGKSGGGAGRNKDQDDDSDTSMIQPVPGLPMSLPPPPDFFGLRQSSFSKRSHEEQTEGERDDEGEPAQKRQMGEKETAGRAGLRSLFATGPPPWTTHQQGGPFPMGLPPRPPLFPPLMGGGAPPPIYYKSQDPQRIGAKGFQD